MIDISQEFALKVSDLKYTYPDGTVALRGVNLTVRRGESVALMGPNGAGKSTLVLHLNGILTGEGRVEVMGVEVNRKNITRVRSMVGLVFQDPDDQLFSPTVYDDVAFGPLNQGLTGEMVERSVGRALAWVGMEGTESRSPHHMSFGEKKRIALATVLSMEPEILVLDEPVANLDPRGKREFTELITTLSGTRLIVTHDVEIVRRICDRTVIMAGGQVVADGRTSALLDDIVLLERTGLV